ncbi:MAG: YceI family protein, partial [Gammaproteobacteria bacterium]|nr:YceI family protein [Gammaproteobacteria bacterium]
MTRILSLILLLALTPLAHADKYQIDTKGAHAFIQFRIKHLGYSWLYGRFNTFDGWFSYDEANPDASQVEVNIDTASVDSNHAERDKHLR